MSFPPSRRSLPGLLLTALCAGVLLVGGGSPALAAQPREAWYARALRLDDAHRLSTGSGVVVAVVDGGVDPGAPALTGALVPGAGIGADAASDGLRDDDPEGHGTSMAGIIAARPVGPGGSSTGFLGVAPDAKILSISTGRETDSVEVAAGIRLATDRGATVVSLSLGSSGPADPDERAAAAYALAHDVVVVAAAGNVDAGDPDPFDHQINAPANIPGVIAVTGSDTHGDFWDGSAAGQRAVLAAPAPLVRAPVPAALTPSGAEVADGTSNSTAIVAGVAALVRAEHPELNAPSVIELLTRTADDKGPRGWDQQFGYGIVDPVAALTAPPVPVASNPLLTPPPGAAGGPLAADEDALLAAAGLPAPGGTGNPARPSPSPSAAVPSGPAASAAGDDGPGRLAWAGGLAAAVVLGTGLGVVAFALRRVLSPRARAARRRPAGTGAAAPGGPPSQPSLVPPPGGGPGGYG
ncbi:S8 family serine peptidase [Pseudofrankia sp. DC12]|uniref:S8 family serine peptidase n=1 Tax=Pseudofrankia sp. DC12 TaxID=683315 RepID=UPI000695A6EE|nr:S8 family serine peptidase [Pseudofrankia sp. DC12]